MTTPVSSLPPGARPSAAAAAGSHPRRAAAVSGPTAPSPSAALAAGGIAARAAPNIDRSADARANMRDMTQIMISIESMFYLLIETMLKQRGAEREAKVEERQAAYDDTSMAADKLRESAIPGIIGASLKAGMQVAGAGFTIGGAARTSGAGDSMQVMNKMAAPQAIGQAVGASGDVLQSGMNIEVQQDQAERTELEGRAQREKSTEETSQQDAQEEAQIIEAVLTAMQQREDSRHEAMRSVV